MKTGITSLVSASLLAAAIVSVSADGVQAKPGNGRGPKNSTTTTTTTTSTSTSSVSCEAARVFMGADACAGPFDGNDTGSGSPLLTQLNDGLFSSFGDFTWEEVTKIDSAEGSYNSNGVNWDVAFDEGTDKSEGTWTLSGVDGSFAISLKSAQSYSVYFYESGSDLSGQENIWKTLGTAVNENNGKGKGLSHTTLYRAQEVSRNTLKVPEPGTSIAIVGVGLTLLSTRKKES